jgi:hypothetical protein
MENRIFEILEELGLSRNADKDLFVSKSHIGWDSVIIKFVLNYLDLIISINGHRATGSPKIYADNVVRFPLNIFVL